MLDRDVVHDHVIDSDRCFVLDYIVDHTLDYILDCGRYHYYIVSDHMLDLDSIDRDGDLDGDPGPWHSRT